MDFRRIKNNIGGKELEKEKQKERLKYAFACTFEEGDNDEQLLSWEEIDQLEPKEKKLYLDKLTVEEYESLPIRGGDSLTSNIDFKLKKYEKRKAWVNTTVENNLYEYELGMKLLSKDERQFSQQKIPRSLDYMATYMLGSLDIESSRNLEYSFYMTEDDYGKRSIAKNIVSMDLEENEHIHANDTVLGGEPYEIRRNRLIGLLKLDKMNYEQKRKLISMGLIEKDNPNSDLYKTMSDLYEIIINSVKKNSDKEIVDMLISGMIEEDIAQNIGCSRQNINKKIKRIVDYIGNWK